MYVRAALALLIFIVPSIASAAVIVNEIAWMGSLDSANDEWIELHNTDSSSVDVSGWVLEDGQSLSIALAGAIPANTFVVLERTDDNSAPGSAFLVYTGALANTGATLVLRDETGTVVDQVAGGENWGNVGGDNTTKETAQYTSAGWVTGAPTPGAKNVTENSPRPTVGESDDSRNGSGPAVSRLRETEPSLVPSYAELQLKVSSPNVVYVNQPVTFEAVPGAVGNAIENSLQYEWNFGDFVTASGKKVSHTYEHPGEYVLNLRAQYARHDKSTQILISVLPINFSLLVNLDGDVLLQNESPYDVDVSQFVMKGSKSVTFPDGSFISKNGTIIVNQERFGGVRLGQVQLYDRTGTLVAVTQPSYEEESSEVSTALNPAQFVDETVSIGTITPAGFSFASGSANSLESIDKTVGESKKQLSAAVVSAESNVPRDVWPLFGLLGIILIGVIGAYSGSQKS